MPRYKFQLAPLHELRRHTRVEQQRRLAEAIQAEQLLEQQIGDLRQELVELQNGYRQATGETDLNITRLLETQRYEMVVKSHIAGLKEKLGQVQVETERRRQAVVAADLEVKSLDRLDERHRSAFDSEERKREQRELDDLASQGVARQTSNHRFPNTFQ